MSYRIGEDDFNVIISDVMDLISDNKMKMSSILNEICQLEETVGAYSKTMELLIQAKSIMKSACEEYSLEISNKDNT